MGLVSPAAHKISVYRVSKFWDIMNSLMAIGQTLCHMLAI